MANAKSEALIRNIIETRAKAVRAGDVDAMMADVADDVVMFDVVDPLRREGVAAARAAKWVATYDGPISWENRDVHVAADGDVAFSHALTRVTGKLKTAAEVDMWFRTTLGLRRIAGRWLITHDHGSVPFNPENGKALLDLKP
ncbi:MAG: nuclear transport factor 2 family protein [Pyrinomonadaceae bacterium]|nr:nuclear transport factor 2 family protein [Pyrinomonadaceae bacterium]